MKRCILSAVIFLVLFLLPQYCSANPLKKTFEEATVAFRTGQFQKAVSLYEKTLEIYPNFSPSFYQLALCHQALGTDPGEVIWLFNRTVELDPNNYQAHEHLGKMYYTQGEFEKAEYHTKRAIEIKPDLINAKLSLAWIYLLGQGEPYKAIPYFEEVIQADSEAPYVHFGLGMAYAQSDQMPLVLGMITELRNSNHEYLAIQLEQMMRENRYIEPVNLSLKKSLGMPTRSKSTLVQSPQVSTISYTKEERERQVRLKGEPRLSEPQAIEESLELSGAERIRQLQQRQAQTKGSH